MSAESPPKGTTRRAPPPSAPVEAAGLAEALHELQVHQVELQMQNDELRQIELELQAARDRYFELFDLAPVAYVIVGSGLEIFGANLAAAELFGVDRAALLGRRLSRYVDDGHALALERYRRVLFADGARHRRHLRLRTETGAALPVLVNGVSTGSSGEPRARLALVDLTEIERTRADLHDYRDRYRSVFDSMAGGLVIVEADGTIAEANDAFCRFVGYEEHTLRKTSWFNLLPSDERARLAGQFREGAKRGVPSIGEQRCVRRDGTVVWGHISRSWLRDELGNVSLGICLVHDITSRRRAEGALRESEALQRAILDTAHDAIVSTDTTGTIKTFNASAERMFGYAAKDVVGKDADMLMGETSHLSELKKHLGPSGSLSIPDGRAVRADGVCIPVSLSVTRVDLGGKTTFTAFMNDLTEQRAAEAALRHAQKMQAVGALASGVAHDFNNLLMGVSGCANIALNASSPTSPARMYLEEIKKSAATGASITGRLLAFARKTDIQVEVFEIDGAIARTRGMLERLLGEEITLAVVPGAPGVRVRLDIAQLEQVLLNIAANARDSMSQGGRLTIETRGGPNADPPAPEGYVALTIADVGAGMAEETRRRVFEPFFTTKAIGSGTGLGLATVYGIVQASGGTIDLTSAEGEGTTFEILWPIVEAEVTLDLGPSDPKSGEFFGHTILLVEDDRLVRMATRHYLERQGYRVLTARNGFEAVQFAKRFADQVDLLLSDIVLPGKSGRVVADQVQALNPDLPIILMTGHPLVADEESPPSSPLLLKPFSENELLVRVHSALEARPPRAAR